MKSPILLTVAILMAFVPALPDARQDVVPQGGFGEGDFAPIGIPPVPLPSEPVVYDTAEGRIRVRVIADGLRRPWGLALLPDDRMLVTEREGHLRLIDQGQLDPTPIPGVPEVFTGVSLAGLMDVELHPGFAENRWVYLTYSKATETGATVAVARGRLEEDRLSEVTDLFVADADGPGYAGSRLAFHPQTEALWASDNAPMGGDEVNIILPGRNYGWPVVSYAREYHGPRASERPWQAGMELPELAWIPSIAPTGILFYTGDRFPAWQGNLFVGSLMTGRIERTGHLERVAFNRQGLEQRREWLLADLRQRIRDVQQGADGLLYVLTDGSYFARQGPRDAAVLRIEPAQ